MCLRHSTCTDVSVVFFHAFCAIPLKSYHASCIGLLVIRLCSVCRCLHVFAGANITLHYTSTSVIQLHRVSFTSSYSSSLLLESVGPHSTSTIVRSLVSQSHLNLSTMSVQCTHSQFVVRWGVFYCLLYVILCLWPLVSFTLHTHAVTVGIR